MNFIFYLLYYPLAFTYDLVATVVSVGQWWDWQAQALNYVTEEAGPVLEVGHGTGHLLAKLQKRGNHPIGIDLSPNMGRLARRWLRKEQVTSVPLTQGSVMTLPFTSATFPTIVSTFPTSYIIEPETLAEFQRVLHPNGKVVIVPNATLDPNGMLPNFMRWLFRITGQAPAETTPAPEAWFTKLTAKLQAAGFDTQCETVKLPHSTVFLVIATAK